MKDVLRKMEAVFILLFCIMVTAGCSDSGSILKKETAVEKNETYTPAENAASDQVYTEDEIRSQEKTEIRDSEDTEIFVDVCGAVKAPGVYRLPEGSRIFQAIAMAGGFLDEAEQSLVNQAEILEDGQQIRIYTKEEAEEFSETEGAKSAGLSLKTGENVSEKQSTDGKININLADKSQLMTLTGIGETRAEAIITYREKNGGFSEISELMQVDGIKEKTYEKLKDKITVQ